MDRSTLRRLGLAGVLLVLVFGALAVFRAPPPVIGPESPVSAPAAVAVVEAAPAVPVAAAPVAQPAEPSPAPAAPEPMPTSTSPAGPPATPTPRPEGTPPRVGLQVGHWQIGDLPEELSRLRRNSGTAAGGVTEVQVNLDIAQRVAGLLRRDGIVVDVLPATIPPGYDADAFVALHADGVQGTGARGFKLATPWRTSRAAQHLLDSITAEYAAVTRLPQDSSITFNMRGYYAFNYFRNQHAIARTTPAVILEMGFLTNPTDRALLTRQPDRVAAGVANGIRRYLRERDPSDGAALLPPEFKLHRSLSADGVDVRSAPRDNASIIGRVDPSRRFMPIQERDGWFQVFGRNGERRFIGWVRKDQVTQTDDPTPTPPPQTS